MDTQDEYTAFLGSGDQEVYDSPFYNTPNINKFDDRNIRIGFRNKVLGIVSIQLLCMIGICALFMENTKMKDLMNGPHQTLLYITAVICTFATLILIMCNERFRYHYPENYVMLALFTASLSYTVALVCTQYQTNTVLYAATATIGVCVVLIIYAIRTKNDFTMIGGGLASALSILIILGFIGLFVHDSIYNYIYSGFGAFLFSLYLIYDVQMVSSGNHKYKLEPDDYIMGAIAIYLDIVNIFIDLLNMTNSRND